MDGGMGMELVRRSPDAADRAWGARVMLDYPDMVVDLHKEFIAAGAQVIIANTYAATRCRLADIGREDMFETLQVTACELAKRARDESGEDVVIAGSLSPIELSYRPDLIRPLDELAERNAEIAELQAPHVDAVLCETMSAAVEALGTAMGAEAGGRPVWMGITVDDENGRQGRGGEPLQDFVSALQDRPVAAWFANCSRAEAVGYSVDSFARMDLNAPFGAYANGFENFVPPQDHEATADRLEARTDLGPDVYAKKALEWVGAGATIVGGCCDVGPAHIAAMRDALTAAGHRLVRPAI
ncbi:MAG: homocysteine S-methyltransferase family protein, partial [Pseudomonadota bacterium]